MALLHQSMASKKGPSFRSTLNQQQQQQHQHTQSYQSAASIFTSIEANIVKKVLNIVGVQQNDNNMMTATICSVIDTVMANTYNMFNKKVKDLADSINNNNNIMLNNINDIIGKKNKNMMHHINNLINKMDKKIDGINTKIMSEEEEKESLVEILLNDIDIIKSKINLYEINNNKFDEINGIKLSINKQSDIMEGKFNKKFEEIGNLIKSKLENLNKMKLNMNKLDKMENNLDVKIYQSQNKMSNKLKEDINNKLKIMENTFVDKMKLNQSVNINKLDEMNLNILNQLNDIKNWKNSLNEPSKAMINKLDEMNIEILNIKNKLNNNMKKIDNMNKNMVNKKNEWKASTFSNDVAFQRMVKKSDNNNNNKIKKINVKYKNKKNKKNNNNKHKNKNKNKKINIKNNNNKEDLVLINDNIITESLDNNNINKDDIIWGQKLNPIITRNKKLFGEKNKEENGIEFYIECKTFDNEYGGCTEGNIVGINIKNNDNGEFKVYTIIKWHDELIKKYVIPERGKDATTTHLNWFVLDRKPEDDERDIHFLNLKGKSLVNNLCLNKLYMGKNIIL